MSLNLFLYDQASCASAAQVWTAVSSCGHGCAAADPATTAVCGSANQGSVQASPTCGSANQSTPQGSTIALASANQSTAQAPLVTCVAANQSTAQAPLVTCVAANQSAAQASPITFVSPRRDVGQKRPIVSVLPFQDVISKASERRFWLESIEKDMQAPRTEETLEQSVEMHQSMTKETTFKMDAGGGYAGSEAFSREENGETDSEATVLNASEVSTANPPKNVAQSVVASPQKCPVEVLIMDIPSDFTDTSSDESLL